MLLTQQMKYFVGAFFAKINFQIRNKREESETPPAGAGGIFWLQAKNELEPFGLPLHLQTGVWSFMRLNKEGI